jgi:hypothetical protein
MPCSLVATVSHLHICLITFEKVAHTNPGCSANGPGELRVVRIRKRRLGCPVPTYEREKTYIPEFGREGQGSLDRPRCVCVYIYILSRVEGTREVMTGSSSDDWIY